MSEVEAKKIHERTGLGLEILGGVAGFGAYLSTYAAAVGELVDQVATGGENFPGGTLGKFAVGCAAVTLVLLPGGHYLKNR